MITRRTYTYDGHNRVSTDTDHQFETVTYAYSNRDEVLSETRSDPDDSGTVLYSYAYDDAGNRTTVTHPGGATTSYTYFANGLLKTQSGEAVNTVDYTYDDLGGQMKTMVTRYTATSGLATTTWNYDAHRGWLDSKIDQTGDAALYDYTAAGRISRRNWDRGAVTDYSYTHAGQLKLVNYTDSGIPVNTTPDIEYSYNRSGTLASVKDGTSSSGTIGTPRYTYSHFYVANHPLLPDYETVAGLYTETKQIKRKWDGINRPGGYLVGTAANEDVDMETTWSYHASDGRISTILSESFETHTDTYSYSFIFLHSFGVAGQYSPNVVSGPQMYTTSAFQANTRLLDTIDNKTASGGATVSNYDYRGRRDTGVVALLTGFVV